MSDECCALLEKPIEEIREDIFFRPDNFQKEPWYGEFQMFLAVGVCQPSKEHTWQVRKALKVMGFDTHTEIRKGKTYILSGGLQQSPAETRNRAE